MCVELYLSIANKTINENVIAKKRQITRNELVTIPDSHLVIIYTCLGLGVHSHYEFEKSPPPALAY